MIFNLVNTLGHSWGNFGKNERRIHIFKLISKAWLLFSGVGESCALFWLSAPPVPQS